MLPGLHNAHLHSGLLRGTAESLSLWDWLATYLDPAHRDDDVDVVARRRSSVDSTPSRFTYR